MWIRSYYYLPIVHNAQTLWEMLTDHFNRQIVHNILAEHYSRLPGKIAPCPDASGHNELNTAARCIHLYRMVFFK